MIRRRGEEAGSSPYLVSLEAGPSEADLTLKLVPLWGCLCSWPPLTGEKSRAGPSSAGLL